MPLPTERNTTYAANDPVKSADMNSIQDQIIAAKHGDVIVDFSPLLAAAGSWTYNANGYITSAQNGTQGNVPLPVLPQGARIKSIRILVSGDGVSELDWALHKLSAAMVDSIVGVLQTVTNPGAAWQVVTYDIPDTALGANETWFLAFVTTGGGTGIKVGNLSFTYDFP